MLVILTPRQPLPPTGEKGYLWRFAQKLTPRNTRAGSAIWWGSLSPQAIRTSTVHTVHETTRDGGKLLFGDLGEPLTPLQARLGVLLLPEHLLSPEAFAARYVLMRRAVIRV